METTKFLDKEGLKLFWEKIKNKYSDAFTGKELLDQVEKSKNENSLSLKSKIVATGSKIYAKWHSKSYDNTTSSAKNTYDDIFNDMELDNNRLHMNSYRPVFTKISSNFSNTDTWCQGGFIYNGLYFVPMTNLKYIDVINLDNFTKVCTISMPTVSGWTIHANTIMIMSFGGVLKLVACAEDVNKPGIIFYNLKVSGNTYTCTFDKAVAAPTDCGLRFINTIFINEHLCVVTGYKKFSTTASSTAVTDENFFVNPPNTVQYIKYDFDYDSDSPFTKRTGESDKIVLPFADCTQGMFYYEKYNCIVQAYGYRGNKYWFAKLRIIPLDNNTTNSYTQYRFDDRTTDAYPQDKWEVQSLCKYGADWYAVISKTNASYYNIAKVEFERSYVDINGSDYFGLYYKGDEYRLNVPKAIELGVLQK